jgi:hypothetical protein
VTFEVTLTPAARADLGDVRARLDEAMVTLSAAAVPGGRDVARAVGDAITAVYEVLAAPSDGAWVQSTFARMLIATRAALARLQEDPAEPSAAHERARDLVASALQCLNALPALKADGFEAPRQSPGVLRASLDEPVSLDATRGLVVPVVPMPDGPEAPSPPPPDPPPPPPITSLAELEEFAAASRARLEAMEAAAEARPSLAPPPAPAGPVDLPGRAAALVFGVAIPPSQVLFERARTCLEDLGMLGLLRRPMTGSSWRAAARTEQRLLRRVDALVACGDGVLPGLVQMLEERPLPDPELTWALVFFFLSLRGSDALDAALRIARAALSQDDAVALSVADAFAHAPHPMLDEALRGWLSAPESAPRTAALDALSRRYALMAPRWETAAREALSVDDEPALRAAARALGRVQGEVDPSLALAMLRHPSPAVARAAIEGRIARGQRDGAWRALELTEAVDGGFAGAVRYVALAGTRRSKAAIIADAGRGGSLALLDALGWYGDVDFVDDLIATLSFDDAATKALAVGALERITGAMLTDDAPDGLDPTLPWPRPAGFVPTPVPEACLSMEVWQRWWSRVGGSAPAGLRLRWGRPWSPMDNVTEMDRDDGAPDVRRMAWLELCARTGGSIAFDPEDWVSRQERAVSAWRAYVSSPRVAALAGTWSSAMLED